MYGLLAPQKSSFLVLPLSHTDGASPKKGENSSQTHSTAKTRWKGAVDTVARDLSSGFLARQSDIPTVLLRFRLEWKGTHRLPVLAPLIALSLFCTPEFRSGWPF